MPTPTFSRSGHERSARRADERLHAEGRSERRDASLAHDPFPEITEQEAVRPMVAIERHATYVLARPSGRLDGQTTPACEAQILGQVGQKPNVMILDLGEVTYMASLGLRMVLLAAKRLKQAGGRLLVCALQPNVREVFEISGFSTIITTFENRGQALEHVSTEPAP